MIFYLETYRMKVLSYNYKNECWFRFSRRARWYWKSRAIDQFYIERRALRKHLLRCDRPTNWRHSWIWLNARTLYRPANSNATLVVLFVAALGCWLASCRWAVLTWPASAVVPPVVQLRCVNDVFCLGWVVYTWAYSLILSCLLDLFYRCFFSISCEYKILLKFIRCVVHKLNCCIDSM